MSGRVAPLADRHRRESFSAGSYYRNRGTIVHVAVPRRIRLGMAYGRSRRETEPAIQVMTRWSAVWACRTVPVGSVR